MDGRPRRGGREGGEGAGAEVWLKTFSPRDKYDFNHPLVFNRGRRFIIFKLFSLGFNAGWCCEKPPVARSTLCIDKLQ